MADMKEIIIDLKKRLDDQKEQLEQVHANYSQAIQDKDEIAKVFEEEKLKVYYLECYYYYTDE